MKNPNNGFREYVPKLDKTLRFYMLVNPAREIEVEVRGEEVYIKHHGEEILALCKDEARKLAKTLEFATPETKELTVKMSNQFQDDIEWLSKTT